MRLLLEIKDNKAAFILELLKNFSFVKAKPLSDETAQLMANLKKSVDEVNLAKAGKRKLRTLDEVLDEL